MSPWETPGVQALERAREVGELGTGMPRRDHPLSGSHRDQCEAIHPFHNDVAMAIRGDAGVDDTDAAGASDRRRDLGFAQPRAITGRLVVKQLDDDAVLLVAAPDRQLHAIPGLGRGERCAHALPRDRRGIAEADDDVTDLQAGLRRRRVRDDLDDDRLVAFLVEVDAEPPIGHDGAKQQRQQQVEGRGHGVSGGEGPPATILDRQSKGQPLTRPCTVRTKLAPWCAPFV